MENAIIKYKIRINTGELKGKEIKFSTDLDVLEFDSLPTILIEKEYLKCWCNNGEFTVLSRKIEMITNNLNEK